MVIAKGLPFVEALPEISVVQLFVVVQEEINKGYQLVTHPLTGNMGPDKNPYKTIILTGVPGKVDFRSLEIIEQALAFANSFNKGQLQRDWASDTLEDLQLIDLDFIKDYLNKD